MYVCEIQMQLHINLHLIFMISLGEAHTSYMSIFSNTCTFEVCNYLLVYPFREPPVISINQCTIRTSKNEGIV